MSDLRKYLEILRANQRVINIKKEVNPVFELPAIMKHAEKEGKAVYFEKVRGSEFPVVSNLLVTREMLALVFGCHRDDVSREFESRSRDRIDPVFVNEAPVQQNVILGDDVNITKLPLVTHCEKDAAPYITAGVVVANDPETQLRNVSINRMMLKNDKMLGVRMMPPQHLGILHAKAERLNKPLEVAVSIGNHPFELLAATTSLPFGDDEFALAGALRKKPLELVRCKTVDLEVPANAEFIIEGQVLLQVREEEGPFGDFMQFYCPVLENHVFKATAITYRDNPIYHTIQASSMDDMHLLALSREARIYHALLEAGYAVKALSLVPTILSCVISMDKKMEGEPKNAAMAAFGMHPWLKKVVVVDTDVNVFDLSEVWWAISNRGNFKKGISVIENTMGFPRDVHDLHTAKLIIDATIPLGQWTDYERKTIPNFDKLNINDYL